MQKALRWQCLWWVCLATASVSAAEDVTLKSFEACTVVELSLDPIHYPLPTNLTVKPLSRWWHLNLALGVDPAKPIACIRLEDSGPWVDVSLFSGDCKNGRNVNLGHTKRPLNNETWTTLALKVLDNAVFVQAPQGESVTLMGPGFSLPQKDLKVKVTEAWGVEAAVGCAVGCPMHHHTSTHPGMKKRVKEWNQDSLHFYFLPGKSFSRLHYDVKCTTLLKTVFRREVEIMLEEKGAAREWHRVELVQTQNNVKVRLNGKPLESVQLPESCISSMHVIWTVGDGYFGFNCKPEGASTAEERESSTHVTERDSLMHPGASAGITLAVVVPLFLSGCAFLVYIKKKNTSQKDPPGKDGKPVNEETTISKCQNAQSHSLDQNEKENSECRPPTKLEEKIEVDEEDGINIPKIIPSPLPTKVKECSEDEKQKETESLLNQCQSHGDSFRRQETTIYDFDNHSPSAPYGQEATIDRTELHNMYNNTYKTI